MRIIAWANVLAQSLFPISVSFTPAMASAAAREQVTVAAKPYILGEGESVESIAQQYGLSLAELQRLNRYRSFAKPFSSLSVGDEIDVPDTPSPFQGDTTTELISKEQAAQYLVSGASLLSSDNVMKSAQQLLGAQITTQFNDAVQQWLHQFGSARVAFSINNEFRLDGSEIDTLLPLFDNQQNLLFTQLGARNKDDRNTFNVGVGFRHFQQDWMYGINTFFDNDLTGKNRRFGIGAELWRDYVKLSANSYWALSDWHASRDFVGYDERPASGYDLRVEGYLPFYAQLGGKLMYEQYRGDQVALFGKENRQQNPYALTAGIHYTPIPLLTLANDYRIGKGGKSDNNINLQLNYRLGEPWHRQIDPAAVASTRTLAGSRHSLVERNNQIVLDYRQQELIRLSLQKQYSAITGSVMTIVPQVVSQYPLERIEWDSLALESAGGRFTPSAGGTAVVTLPPYQKEGASNSYLLTAIAYDVRGNASARASTQLNVLPNKATINPEHLIALQDNAISNGSDINKVEVMVTGVDGNPLPDQVVSFSADNGALLREFVQQNLTAAASLPSADADNQMTLTTNSDGKASVAVSNTRAGISRVSATVDGSTETIGITFLPDADNPCPTHSKLHAEPEIIVADGQTAARLHFVLKDINGNEIPGQDVTFHSSLENSVVSEVTDLGNGSYSATLTGTVAGHATITPKIADQPLDVEKPVVQLLPDSGNLDTEKSTLVVEHNTLVANGSDKATITLTLKDKNGNPVLGQPVQFSSSLADVSFSAVQSDNGVYSATFSGTRAGNTELRANVGTWHSSAVSVTLNADSSNLDVEQSTLELDRSTLVANGHNMVTVTLHLKDRYGNPVPGQDVQFSSSLQHVTFNVVQAANGVYSASLSGTRAGTATLRASIGEWQSKTVNLTLYADNSNLDLEQSTLSLDKTSIIASGNQAAGLTLKLRDKHGNPVLNQQVEFSSSLPDVSFSPVQTQNGDYVLTVRGTRAGVATLWANVGEWQSKTISLTLTADSSNLNVEQSTLELDRTNLLANGSDEATIKLTLKDKHGNLVSGQPVQFISSLEDVTFGAVEEELGVYRATLTGTYAGITTLKARVDQWQSNAVSLTLRADSSNLNANKSTLELDRSTLVANGINVASIIFTLRDQYGNLVPDQHVQFSSSLGGISFSEVKEEDGVYSTTLTGTLTGSTTLQARVGDWQSKTVNLTLVADSSNLDADKSELALHKEILIAHGEEHSGIMLTLKDKYGNQVLDQQVTFSSSLPGIRFSQVTISPQGIYVATISSTHAGVATLWANVGEWQSNTVTLTVIPDSKNLDATKSTLELDRTTLIATGSDEATIKLTLKDRHGNLVPDQQVQFSSSLADVSFSEVSAKDGVYSATLTGTRAGSATLKATVGSWSSDSVSVTLNADSSNLDVEKSTLELDHSNLVASGSDQATITLTLKDKHGNPVAGQSVQFSSSLADVSFSEVQAANGIYSATLTGTRAGTTTLQATVGEWKSNTVKLMLNSDSNHLDATKSTLELDKTSLVATGQDAATIKLILKDRHGNTVSGQTVQFTSSLADVSFGAVQAAANGVYSATVTGTRAGSAALRANVDDWQSKTVSLTLTADSSNLDAVKSTIQLSNESLVADGSDNVKITLSLRDGHSNLVSGQEVQFISNLDDISFSEVTEEGGIYSATLTGTRAGTALLQARVGEWKSTAISLSLTADSTRLDAEKSMLVLERNILVANDNDQIEIRFTLKDRYGNPVSGQNVQFTSSLEGVRFFNMRAVNGVYSATLMGTRAGSATLRASVGEWNSNGVTLTLTGDRSRLSPSKSELVADVTTLVANGRDVSTIVLTLRDENGNLIGGQNVQFTQSKLHNVTISTVEEPELGVYRAQLSGISRGTALVQVKVGTYSALLGIEIELIGDKDNLSTKYSRLASPAEELVRVDASTTERGIDGTNDSMTVSLFLRDINQNTVDNQEVIFTHSGADATFGATTDRTVGAYHATFRMGDVSGTTSIGVKVNGTVLAVEPIKVKLTKILRTSYTKLGTMNLPGGYDLTEFTFGNGNWSSEPLNPPTSGMKDGDVLIITSQAIFDSNLNTTRTDITRANPLVLKTGNTIRLVYRSATGKWHEEAKPL
ncbi:invasin domain 3-containing protein [Serratia microhaemolytica]|uniref:invasin domain 3-containing protein n=1 Tax=Serratia microhaemolytica TaxID=2675110 RepID=UPI00139234C7|nr:invasin domain 3-containing protein [Serratia microhaemolytica]